MLLATLGFMQDVGGSGSGISVEIIEKLLLGSTGLTAWLIYDNIRLRQENSRLNQEARDTARSSIEAIVRLATERKP